MQILTSVQPALQVRLGRRLACVVVDQRNEDAGIDDDAHPRQPSTVRASLTNATASADDLRWERRTNRAMAARASPGADTSSPRPA